MFSMLTANSIWKTFSVLNMNGGSENASAVSWSSLVLWKLFPDAASS